MFRHPEANLFYAEAGDGDPLLCLHGFGASTATWRKLVPHLAGRRRVITLDLKGCGRSSKPNEGGYRPSDQAALVIAFIEALKLSRLTLLGHSYGGTVALLTYLELQSRRRNPVTRLILLAAAAYPQPLPLSFRLLRTPLLGRLLLAAAPVRPIVALTLRRSFHRPARITQADLQAYTTPLLSRGSRQAMLRTARQLPVRDAQRLTQAYRGIAVPTLLIWGAHDRIVPPRLGRLLHAAIRCSRLVVLPDAGHMPHEECPEATLRCILEFLRQS